MTELETGYYMCWCTWQCTAGGGSQGRSPAKPPRYEWRSSALFARLTGPVICNHQCLETGLVVTLGKGCSVQLKS